MSDHIDQRASRAATAVREGSDRRRPDAGLDAVVRRASRPRASAVAAVLMVIALAVPAAAWLVRERSVQLIGTPPATEAPQPTTAPEPTSGPAPAIDPDGATPQPTPTSTGPTPLGDAGTVEVATPGFPDGGGEIALLTDVRVAGQQGFDRVVFELDGPDVPAYRVRLTDPPITQGGSGDELSVEGPAYLEVILTPASGADLRDGTYEPVYRGPARVRGDTQRVTEVVRTGDFEATLGWVIGLHERSAFSVTVLQAPLRLVIDIETP